MVRGRSFHQSRPKSKYISENRHVFLVSVQDVHVQNPKCPVEITGLQVEKTKCSVRKHRKTQDALLVAIIVSTIFIVLHFIHN